MFQCAWYAIDQAIKHTELHKDKVPIYLLVYSNNRRYFSTLTVRNIVKIVDNGWIEDGTLEDKDTLDAQLVKRVTEL